MSKIRKLKIDSNKRFPLFQFSQSPTKTHQPIYVFDVTTMYLTIRASKNFNDFVIQVGQKKSSTSSKAKIVEKKHTKIVPEAGWYFKLIKLSGIIYITLFDKEGTKKGKWNVEIFSEPIRRHDSSIKELDSSQSSHSTGDIS